MGKTDAGVVPPGGGMVPRRRDGATAAGKVPGTFRPPAPFDSGGILPENTFCDKGHKGPWNGMVPAYGGEDAGGEGAGGEGAGGEGAGGEGAGDL